MGPLILVGLVLLVWLGPASTADMSKEGYANLELIVDRPNLPYVKDTNRYSDGFTSRSSVESTSTSFPEYVGALALTNTRYKEYLAYKQSAIDQGVALAGEGDAEVEDARINLIERYGGVEGVRNAPKPTQSFLVYAPVKWNPSRFAIQEGEIYSIEARGSDTGFSTQFWNDGGIRVNAEGYSSYYDAISNCYIGLGRCRSHLKKKRRLPLANWMTLACGIGDFSRPVSDVKEGAEADMRFLPLDEATVQQTVFVVGRQLTFRAKNSGMLICFANDAQTLYWNNRGWLNVTVTRESWPPSNATTYLQAKDPACDSATAVYSLFQEDPQNPGKYIDNPNPLKCNLNGGGAGWRAENIKSKDARYASGSPEEMYADRPSWIAIAAEAVTASGIGGTG